MCPRSGIYLPYSCRFFWSPLWVYLCLLRRNVGKTLAVSSAVSPYVFSPQSSPLWFCSHLALLSFFPPIKTDGKLQPSHSLNSIKCDCHLWWSHRQQPVHWLHHKLFFWCCANLFPDGRSCWSIFWRPQHTQSCGSSLTAPSASSQ